MVRRSKYRTQTYSCKHKIEAVRRPPTESTETDAKRQSELFQVRAYLPMVPMRTPLAHGESLESLRLLCFLLFISGWIFYDIREPTVEVLSIVAKGEAAAWLERAGEKA